MALSRYEFSMISNPSCISFHHEDWQEDDKIGVPMRSYSKILFKDSLFDFFPYGEVYYKDSSGQIVDSVFFVEGLELKCKLGYVKTDEEKNEQEKANTRYVDYLEHDYIWSASEINNILFSRSVSGHNLFMLISKHFYNDFPKSKTFNHENGKKKETISDILINTILPEWGIDKSKYKIQETISKTSGTPYLNQNNISNKLFISKIAEYAYTENEPKSGFYTFFNANGEFYFMTVKALMDQKPVSAYKLDVTTDMTVNPMYIKDYRVFHGGVPVNFDNYKRKIYKYTASGLAETTVDTDMNILFIADKLEVDDKTKLLIRKQHLPTSGNSANTYAGIQEEENGLEFQKGFNNYFYRDTMMCYRMVIVVDFNPNNVSGKTISIEIEKQTKDSEIATEFSGTWLICESIHVIDDRGIPYSQLTVSKPQIQIDSTHIFYNDFKA